MKSIFEKQLLCESTFSIEDEKVATKTIMESYISGETPLEELCEEIGLSEDLKKYRNGELSDEEMAGYTDTPVGKICIAVWEENHTGVE